MMKRAGVQQLGRLVGIVVVVVLGLLPTTRPAFTAGVTVVRSITTDSWLLGGNDAAFQASMVAMPLPNCKETVCPIDLITVFANGYIDVLRNLAPVAKVVQVTTTQYVVATGRCQSGTCTLGAYAINRERAATATFVDVAQIAFSKARCGLHFTYAGGTYTLKPVLTGTGYTLFTPQVYAGRPPCT